MTHSQAAPFDPTASQRPPRDAATLVVVRDAAAGLEVLLMHRADHGDHNSGAWVFPGGTLDAELDRAAHAVCRGGGDAAWSARLGLAEGGLDYPVAAIRECFEESGLLFAVEADVKDGAATKPVTPDLRWAAWRAALHRGECSLRELCEREGLRLATDSLVYLSHWLTPLGRAKRYDTRFFVAVSPAGQEARHDGTEMTGLEWLRPGDALARGDSLKLMGPTRATLHELQRFDSVAALMAWAGGPREVSMIHPRVGAGSQGLRPVLPGEGAYAELGRLDPLGHGTASYEIVTGRPVRLSAHVIRVTAPNASVMTGPGTNSYLVGGGPANEWTVIDPGPALAAHVEALLHAAPGRITRIFATHTHSDHSPAAAELQRHTGAAVLGRVADPPDHQDATFHPTQPLRGGERMVLAPQLTLRVIHTPGHASNHLCYLLEEEKLLFTGDHVMQASTVVINPPDGDMAAYLQSLRALMQPGLQEAIDWLAPGHGFLMDRPKRAFQGIVDHRLKREAKVLQGLHGHGPGTLEALLPRVYDDVDPRLLPVAARSLLAHLLKLRADGRARQAGEAWSAV